MWRTGAAVLGHAGLALTSAFLAVKFPRVLFAQTVTLSAAFGLRLFVGKEPFDVGKVAKILGVLTFGLGSVISFAIAPQSVHKRYLPGFTKYINTAVLGNVVMMSFAPGGDTLRGKLSPLLCVAMSVWLAIEGTERKWNTVEFDGALFVYKASSLSWVLHHAVYRACLMTLPCFEWAKYILLEPISLGTMLLLSYTCERPANEMFGYADTIAVASSAAIAALADFDVFQPEFLSTEFFDHFISCVQAATLVSTFWNILKRLRNGEQNSKRD